MWYFTNLVISLKESIIMENPAIESNDIDLVAAIENLLNPPKISDERWSQLETKLDEEEPATMAEIKVQIKDLCKRTGLAELRYRLKSSQYILAQVQSTIELITEEIGVKSTPPAAVTGAIV
jgi:hypothetical protein